MIAVLHTPQRVASLMSFPVFDKICRCYFWSSWQTSLCRLRAQSYAERLRLGLAVMHGEAGTFDSEMVDGPQSPPLQRPATAHTGLELPCKTLTFFFTGALSAFSLKRFWDVCFHVDFMTDFLFNFWLCIILLSKAVVIVSDWFFSFFSFIHRELIKTARVL